MLAEGSGDSPVCPRISCPRISYRWVRARAGEDAWGTRRKPACFGGLSARLKPCPSQQSLRNTLYEHNFHLVRVYAIRNPLRSALRWDSLPGNVTIIARSHP
jgi:hypothetical protein